MGLLRERLRRILVSAATAALISSTVVAPVPAASPTGATLAPDATGQGSIGWDGTVTAGDTTAGSTDDCFDSATRQPRDPTISGCDFFKLDVSVPAGFYDNFLGGVEIDLTDFGLTDIDLGIYVRNADGSRGNRVGGSGEIAGQPEEALVSRAAGPYYVVAVPFTVAGAQTYRGEATFKVKVPNPTLAQLNSNPSLLGPTNYRASHDQYISHSEPTVAMDPLNHKHLMAGSKMYQDLPGYLFKIGTYESLDGGKTWTDYGHLPGYCTDDAGNPFPPACDPTSDRYRVTSDISIAFDDEGNAYANVLDAPGGASTSGWNMTVHVKRPSQPWTGPIIVHNIRRNAATKALFLDDKNWLAVDNVSDVNGLVNKPRDGKVGTIYVCWGLDFDTAGQQIVLMRSTDGGATWGGFTPGDNTPYQLSQQTLISGIGCHIAIGPQAEVYVTWYDNLLDVLMQVKSTDRGHTFTFARPIAAIHGVNDPFEGQGFRNLSIPMTGVGPDGTVYVTVMSQNGEGAPFPAGATGTPPSAIQTGSDIILFKSTDGGGSYTGPIRVNHDTGAADQFQPALAITPKGQIVISYFDRRRDPNNYFIQTWLSRSNDGGTTWTDVPVGHLFWDPSVNPPISPSGEFIGDYQGIVADDDVAIPFWNDTQAATLSANSRNFSPYQEVWAARIPNSAKLGGPGR